MPFFLKCRSINISPQPSGKESEKTPCKRLNGCAGAWNTLSFTTVVPLLSVYFTDTSTGYVVGGSGIILKTINGGTTWTALTSITNNDLISVYFTDTNTGYAVGAYTIVKTIDGGNTWTDLSSGIKVYLWSVYFTKINTGYAVGNAGTILKTINGGEVVSIKETKLQESTYNIYPNPANNKITIAHSGNLAEEAIISIFDIKGEQIMYNKFQNQNRFEMDVSTLTKGIYFVKIQTNSGIKSKKLVIQ